jgi:hypothetical protein
MKRVKKTGSTFTEDNSAHEDSNSNLEQEEWKWAERELACWYVPHLGSTKEVWDKKISDKYWILERWDAQGGGFSEIGINWRRIPQREHLESWFRTSQDEYCTSASHNCHKKIAMTTRQQEGMAIFPESNSGNTSYGVWAISEALADGICGSFKPTPATGPGWW